MSNFLFFFLAFPACLIYQSACLAVMGISALVANKLGYLLGLSADGAGLCRCFSLIFLTFPPPTAWLQIPYRPHLIGAGTLKLPMQVVYAVTAEFIYCPHCHLSLLFVSWKTACEDSPLQPPQVPIP